jgi:hypothetical protein
MSLVNDALKRAKEAQQQTPAPPISGPPFKDLDTVEEPARWKSSPVTMAVVAVIALIVVWQSLRRGNGPSRSDGNATKVAARSNVTPEASPATVEPPSPKAAPATIVAPDATALQSASGVVTPKEAPLSPAVSAGQIAEHAQQQVVPAAPPAPPPLKLQAVIWIPKQPSAMISGKTVFVGDRIQEFKVTKITQDSATLSGPGGVQELRIVQ